MIRYFWAWIDNDALQGGFKKLSLGIEDYAQNQGLEIVSASSAFVGEKIVTTVVFRKSVANQAEENLGHHVKTL